MLAFGCLTPTHAAQFKAFVRQIHCRFTLHAILAGDEPWPAAPAERDVLYFLAQSFRAHLIKNLPHERENLSGNAQELAVGGKAMIRDLAVITLEIAQMVVTDDGDSQLPNWFLVEVVRDLPRLVEARRGA